MGWFDDVMGVVPGDCTNDEVEMLLPRLYRAYAAQAAAAGRLLFCKAHDAFRDTPAGEPLFPDDVTIGAIYVVRNPLDVVVSSAFYVDHASFAESIARLNDQGAQIGGPLAFRPTPVRLVGPRPQLDYRGAVSGAGGAIRGPA